MLPERNGKVWLQGQDPLKVQKPGIQAKKEASLERMIQKSGQMTQSAEWRQTLLEREEIILEKE